MDGGAWKAAVHVVAEGRTRLSVLKTLYFPPDFILTTVMYRACFIDMEVKP